MLIMLATKSHSAIEIVGTVPARQGHGGGARLGVAEMKEAMESSKCMMRGVC